MADFILNPGLNPVSSNDGIVVTYITPWDAAKTYNQYQTVTFGTQTWISRQNANVGNTPTFGSAFWSYVQQGVQGPTGYTGYTGPSGNGYTGPTGPSNLRTTPVAYGSLPAASTVPGQIASVNNSSVNTWGGVADGAGAFTVLVWSNGIAWTVIGQ